MTIKSILLDVDATERSAVRLAVARDLAERHDATVRAIYVAMPSAMHVADADMTGEGASLMYTLAQRTTPSGANARTVCSRLQRRGRGCIGPSSALPLRRRGSCARR